MREAIRCTQISDAPRAQHTLAAHLCTSRGNQRAVGGRGHQRQSEVIRSNQRPSESGRRQSTGSHSPSKTVRRRSSGFIRGNQGSSVVIRAHRKPFEGDHQGSSVVISGHQWSSGFIGNRSKAIIRVHQWSSGVIGNRSKVISGPSSSAQSSSAYLPSEGLELFMKGVIRGHQGPSRSSAYLPSEGLKLFMKGPHHRR